MAEGYVVHHNRVSGQQTTPQTPPADDDDVSVPAGTASNANPQGIYGQGQATVTTETGGR